MFIKFINYLILMNDSGCNLLVLSDAEYGVTVAELFEGTNYNLTNIHDALPHGFQLNPSDGRSVCDTMCADGFYDILKNYDGVIVCGSVADCLECFPDIQDSSLKVVLYDPACYISLFQPLDNSNVSDFVRRKVNLYCDGVQIPSTFFPQLDELFSVN